MSTNVLVVDDSATVRQEVSAALADAGLSVTEAADGLEGENRIKEGGIDCVICDVNMPIKNGIEMVSAVKKLEQFAPLPIIMLTTEGAKDLIKQAKQAGATGWIIKPFKPNLLVSAVKRLTGVA